MKTFSLPADGVSELKLECPLCADAPSTEYWQCEGFSFNRCSQCGMLFQSRIGGNDAIARRYAAEYAEYEHANEEGFFVLMRKALDDISFADYEREFGRGAGFLDVGCATGLLVSHFLSRGWKARGVEICEPAARSGTERFGIDIHCGSLESARFPTGSFDVVHCSHLIEHLSDPAGFLEEVRRVIRPGGIFIVVTPDCSGFQARLFGPRWRSAIADHLYLFSRVTLERLSMFHGFARERFGTWGGLGVGYGPRPLKKVLDPLAKVFGFGDVMIAAFRQVG